MSTENCACIFEYEKVKDLFLWKTFKRCKPDCKIGEDKLDNLLDDSLKKREIIYIDGMAHFYEIFINKYFYESFNLESLLYTIYNEEGCNKTIKQEFQQNKKLSLIVNSLKLSFEFNIITFDITYPGYRKNSFDQNKIEKLKKNFLDLRKKITTLETEFYIDTTKLFNIYIKNENNKIVYDRKNFLKLSLKELKEIFMPILDKYFYEPGADGFYECKKDFTELSDKKRKNEEITILDNISDDEYHEDEDEDEDEPFGKRKKIEVFSNQ